MFISVLKENLDTMQHKVYILGWGGGKSKTSQGILMLVFNILGKSWAIISTWDL